MGKKRVAMNGYGVPYHEYRLYLDGGSWTDVNIGEEEQWGDIQRMDLSDFDALTEEIPDCYNDLPGWGNDTIGHTEIVAVKDKVNNKFLNVRKWAKEVWSYASNYAGELHDNHDSQRPALPWE